MSTYVSIPPAKGEVAPAARASSAKEVSAPTPTAERLASLDALRGFIMFWIIGGAALMSGLQHLSSNPFVNVLADELHHTPWQGLRFYDCIWPCFLLMVGISVALSAAKRSSSQTDGQMMLHALKRVIALFLLSSLQESINRGSPSLVGYDALQQIAIAYFVAFLLARKSAWAQVMVAGLILAAHALVEAFVPAPGIPAGTYAFNHNIVYAIDVAVLGRAHPAGFGNLLCGIPPISICILGLIIGQLLIRQRSTDSRIKVMGGVGLLCLAWGYALSAVIPIIMKMATASWAFLAAGWSSLLFMLFFWLIDVRGYHRWTLPLRVVGMNALFIYVFSLLIPIGQWASVFSKGMVGAFNPSEPFLRWILALAAEWAILFWMYRRKIFIKA